MLKKLKATLKTTPTKYTFNDIQDIAKKLQPLTNKDDAEKQQHIINIQNKCPFCGGELTLRNGKYGRFWGCSNYPKCKFTRPEE